MKKLLFFTVILVYRTTAEDVIYRLDDEDYYRMPPKYQLDRFKKCLSQPDGVYCTVWADLVSNQSSDLLHMIQAYSAHYTKHYNYSNIRYGLCLTGSGCRRFYHEDGSQQAMWTGAEACLNHSLTREYSLQARVTDVDCYRHGHRFETNAVDVAILAALAIILALNVVGSIYDKWIRDPDQPGNQYLVAFSFFVNWRRLVEPPSSDPRQVRLRAMNGIRALTSILVILGHIPLIMMNVAVNPKHFEDSFDILLNHITHQGHMVTLTFFTMSGFLLAYNSEMPGRQVSLQKLPRNIYKRWLRLSPTNLVVLMLTVVWYKYITIGPLFREMVVRESLHCRQYWLYNVFFANNFVTDSLCNLQIWYLSSDIQIHIMALLALALAPKRPARTWALAALYLLGIGYTAYLVYSMDLDGTYLATPTVVNEHYYISATFNTIFRQAVPNLPPFVIGMCFGFLVLDLEKKGLLNVSYRKYRVLLWAATIYIFLVLMLGAIFYRDGPRPNMLVRVLFAPIVKPMFTLGINLIILGCIYRCDDLVRGILEWNGWVPVMRISYCVYLVHMSVLRYTGGTRDSLYYLSLYHTVQDYFGIVCMVLIYSTLLHLLVEAPFTNIQNLPDKPHKKMGESVEQTKEDAKTD